MKKVIGFIAVFVLTMSMLCTGVFAASDGELLTGSDEGWKRYDDTDSRIVYTNYSLYNSGSTCYKSTYHYNADGNSSVSFRFTGTKLKIKSSIITGITKYEITIDGKSVSFSPNPNQKYTAVLYEPKDLTEGTHNVVINGTNNTREWTFTLDYVDIDANAQLLSQYEPGNLKAIPGDKKVSLQWDVVEGATEYKVKYGTAPGNYSLSKPVTVTESVYGKSDIEGLTNGTTYYFAVCAVVNGVEKEVSNEVSTTPKAEQPSTEEIITVETPKDKLSVGNEFTTDIVLHNAVNMCAEDFKVTYNPQLFEYLGYEEVTGLKVYKEVKNTGEVRLIVASLGKENAINGDKTMVKLKFRALKAGKDKIDVVRGRIANNGTIEKDILEANCGEKEVSVEGVKDVNRTGEFTLLDLGIDAWYYGESVANTDATKYDADVVANSQVDNEDLLAIVAEMLNNTNYTPNM